MDGKKPAFYVTTAIPYASGKPHFGNTYEVILADAVARYRRERGFDVFFCTGTDEHGQKIEILAEKAGTDPQRYVDGVTGQLRDMWDRMGASYDCFIRTTDAEHQRIVQGIFERLRAQGDIYKGRYEGLYCVPCESFFTETQAPDGICPDCGRPLRKASEEAYFFRMSRYADRLMRYIDEHPDFIRPESRRREMVNNFLKAGLQDLCVTRTSFKWGVPVPSDPGHVMYVWIDALPNYITALGYDPSRSYEEQSERFRKFWPADAHIVGKDIMRFHTIYWPIFLMALGLPLPKTVFGHPWFNFGADKMSKSRGNLIYADELADRFTVDGVRYYALSEMPYGTDGSITEEAVATVYNRDLVNNLGNLFKRTLDMQRKYFDRRVASPAPPADEAEAALDDSLAEACETARLAVTASMDTYHVADALEAIFALFRRANKYIDETTPWVLARDPNRRARLGTVLYNLLETIRRGATLLKPFLPGTAETMLGKLCSGGDGYASLEEPFGQLKPGTVVEESTVLFARIDAKAAPAEPAAETSAAAGQGGPARETGPERISYDEFMRTELRAARVVGCEPVPKTDKLLRLQLDLGDERRQVVSGIAKRYRPEDLIGKTVVVVANLRPAVIRGIASDGMILASGEDEVRVVFLDPDVKPGERIR